MQNEEAIDRLRLDIEMAQFDPITGNRRCLFGDEKELVEAQEMAIEALKDRWILVSDRVPEDDRLVIVCTESGQVYTDYYFDDQSDYWRLAHIIAWQDLPKAYKKEDSE